MTLTDGYLKDLNAPLRAESYPELPQDIAEIVTSVSISAAEKCGRSDQTLL